MKIYQIKDVNKFVEVVNSCKGTVELVSKQGDRLNLKSELTKFLAVTNVFNNEPMLSNLELVASDPEDVQKLFDYMVGQ